MDCYKTVYDGTILPFFGKAVDRLDAMGVLVTAVETGSLSAAGRRLGMPLATVSRKVSDLEAHLKTRLLIRSTRKLTLTDAGQSYVLACKRILEDVAEVERTATGEYASPKGDLMVTAPVVFGRLHVLPIVIEFLKAYPRIDVRLVLVDRIANLAEEQIDVAVRIGELPDSSLVAISLGFIRRIVCASPAYLAERSTPTRPSDLRTHDCISFEGLVSPRTWTFNAKKGERSVAVRSRLIANTAEAAIDAALAGLGITRVLSYQAEDAVRSAKLKVVLRDFEPPPWPVSLVFAGQRLLPQKLRAFIDFAAPRLRSALAREHMSPKRR
jgi:DNA-binding transcriptional LysR family regulator